MLKATEILEHLRSLGEEDEGPIRDSVLRREKSKPEKKNLPKLSMSNYLNCGEEGVCNTDSKQEKDPIRCGDDNSKGK
jgi:hypothetical protein